MQIELSLPTGETERLSKYYGFSTDRHAGSFYLKIGAGIIKTKISYYLSFENMLNFAFKDIKESKKKDFVKVTMRDT